MVEVVSPDWVEDTSWFVECVSVCGEEVVVVLAAEVVFSDTKALEAEIELDVEKRLTRILSTLRGLASWGKLTRPRGPAVSFPISVLTKILNLEEMQVRQPKHES